jgi:RHS repeat-associated protein
VTLSATSAIGEVSRSRSYYRGEQIDSDLGLYYLRARYYNPASGRFLSRDPEDGKPIDPKTLHKYLYAGGDPVNSWDPTGRATMLETGSIDDVIDEPALPALREFGQTSARILCKAVKAIVPWFSTWPPSAPTGQPVPIWLLKLVASLCTGFGM